MAVSVSTSWQYAATPTLVGTTTVNQLTTDQTENKYYTLATSLAPSVSTSWQYAATPTLVGTTTVQQLKTDQTENKYYTLTTALTGAKQYNWENNYNVTLPGVTPLGTYAQTGGAELTVKTGVTQIWAYS